MPQATNVTESKLVSRETKSLESGVSRAGGTGHRISNLDGVRGLAIALVLICHSGNLLISNSIGSTLFWRTYWHIAMSLWIGVDIFFVLSGFLITSILLKSREAKNYYTGFYGRRALRILPMFVVVLSLVCSFLLWKGECKIWQCLVLLFSLGNWLIVSDSEILPLTHFWTLAVEEQFYLVWPFVIKHLTPRRTIQLCVGLFAIATLLRLVLALSGTPPYVIYKITPASWDGLALGALLACLPYSPEWEVWFIKNFARIMWVSGVFLAAVFVYHKFGLYCFSPFCLAFGLPFVNILGVGLVFSALKAKTGAFAAFLNDRSLQWLGRYSYSIYLIHYPCFCVANWLIGEKKAFTVNILIALGVYVALPLLLARLTWFLIEQPFLNLKGKFKTQFANEVATK